MGISAISIKWRRSGTQRSFQLAFRGCSRNRSALHGEAKRVDVLYICNLQSFRIFLCANIYY